MYCCDFCLVSWQLLCGYWSKRKLVWQHFSYSTIPICIVTKWMRHLQMHPVFPQIHVSTVSSFPWLKLIMIKLQTSFLGKIILPLLLGKFLYSVTTCSFCLKRQLVFYQSWEASERLWVNKRRIHSMIAVMTWKAQSVMFSFEFFKIMIHFLMLMCRIFGKKGIDVYTSALVNSWFWLAIRCWWIFSSASCKVYIKAYINSISCTLLLIQ